MSPMWPNQISIAKAFSKDGMYGNFSALNGLRGLWSGVRERPGNESKNTTGALKHPAHEITHAETSLFPLPGGKRWGVGRLFLVNTTGPLTHLAHKKYAHRS